MTNPTSLQSWKELQDSAKNNTKINPNFKDMSISIDGMLFDYSKNKVTSDIMSSLLNLARECNLEQKRDDMFAGVHINNTEDRAVLHSDLRSPNAPQEVLNTITQMQSFTEQLHKDNKITDIVNIGIGGSSLGPELVTKALKKFHRSGLKAHYVSNVEASDLNNTLKQLNPETTLFIIASKTFTTAETMQNATLAKEWFNKNAPDAHTEDHFIAVSTNIDKVKEFGIAEYNIFPMWDWVGGRYSLWSAIGLSCMIMVGVNNFKQLLNGAHTMDEHFKSAPLDKNIPVISALLGIWYRNFLNYSSYAVIPYHTNLARMPAWLQQLDMESNGKSVDKNGAKVDYATGPMIFGEPGTDSQHSFFQWLHQGTTPIPVDLIAFKKPCCGTTDQQTMLLANCIAQGEALMTGKSNKQEPHRNFKGNRPSTTILLDELSPYTLGLLLAMYEQKIFVQGAIWNINSFDQWGVQLGKVLAENIQQELSSGDLKEHDSSTLGLLKNILE